MLPTSQALWNRYRENPSIQNRNALVEQYLPFAKTVAETYCARRGIQNFADREDFASIGALWLLKLIDRYDPRKALFETYASKRIVGAIRDELRKQDIVPRRKRALFTEIRTTERTLANDLGRPPFLSELADSLALSAETILASRSPPTFLSLSPYQEREEDRPYDGRVIADTTAPDPGAIAERNDMLQHLLSRLDQVDRKILSLRSHDIGFREIGDSLHLSTANANLRYNHAVNRLRQRFSRAGY